MNPERNERTWMRKTARMVSAAGLSGLVLLLDLVLALSAPCPPPGAFDRSVSGLPASQSFRTVAERAGNLAAMHDGAGTGVQVQMRGGRTSPSFARRVQTGAARFGPARILESVPISPERIASPAQTFLFQLFPRRFLPVRAGPFPA